MHRASLVKTTFSEYFISKGGSAYVLLHDEDYAKYGHTISLHAEKGLENILHTLHTILHINQLSHTY